MKQLVVVLAVVLARGARAERAAPNVVATWIATFLTNACADADYLVEQTCVWTVMAALEPPERTPRPRVEFGRASGIDVARVPALAGRPRERVLDRPRDVGGSRAKP